MASPLGSSGFEVPSRPPVSSSAVLVNPAKVPNQTHLRRSVLGALAEDGWPEPAWLETTETDWGREQARRAIAEGADVLFVCGGDGTVLSAVEAIAGTNTALAVLPAGTGNVLALNLGLPTDLLSATRVATRGARRRIDLGEVDGRQFAVATGIGLDALMLQKTPSRAKVRLGWVAYAASVVQHLGETRFSVEISLDNGTPIAREVHSVLVANVGRFPGGISLLPQALPDDGVLDVAVIAPRRLHDWVRLLTTLVGSHPRGGRLETFQARRVEVRTDRLRPRELDGDPLPASTEMRVRVRAGALVVCVPKVAVRAM
jgi:YegS/Rv2252/BmrU family lipid kinase